MSRWVFLLLMLGSCCLAEEGAKQPLLGPAVSGVPQIWRQDFDVLPPGWVVRPTFRTKPAIFAIVTNASSVNRVLSMTADSASATLTAPPLPEVDLKRMPWLRWNWRVTVLPDAGDGRESTRDDQAIGIYITSGTRFSQRALAYRWETETPVGTEGKVTYFFGAIKVVWFALRNKTNVTADGFILEERNLRDDFQKVFGFVPDKVYLGICCNSQYSGTRAGAELDWIEFSSGATGSPPISTEAPQRPVSQSK
jgi:hypothetical protein